MRDFEGRFDSLSTLGRGVRVGDAVSATANADSKRQPMVVQPGEVKVIPAKEEKPLKAAPRRGHGDKDGRRSWKRYAEWLLERGLVVRIGPAAVHAPLVSAGVKAARAEAPALL